MEQLLRLKVLNTKKTKTIIGNGDHGFKRVCEFSKEVLRCDMDDFMDSDYSDTAIVTLHVPVLKVLLRLWTMMVTELHPQERLTCSFLDEKDLLTFKENFNKNN